MRNVLCTIVLVIVATVMSIAQFNVKVAIEYDRSSSDALQSIIDTWNINNPEYDAPLEQVKGRTGLCLGLRYRFDFVSLEAHFSSISAGSEATGFVNSQDILKVLKSSSRNYGIGMDLHHGMLSWGGMLGYNNLKFATEIGSSGKELLISEERQPFVRAQFAFNFESSRIAMAIRPHVQWALKSYNLTPLQLEFAEPADASFKPNSWGISFILYNGRQR